MMDTNQIARYRKHIEFTTWILIVGGTLFVNFSTIPEVVENRNLLNFFMASFCFLTTVYYHLVAPRRHTEGIILSFLSVYLLLIIASVHFTGSLQSVVFCLMFVPILFSAMLLGTSALLLIVLGEVLWIYFEYFRFFLLTTSLPLLQAYSVFLERIISITLVSFVIYINSKEIFNRLNEYRFLKEEKARIEKVKDREEKIFQSIQDFIVALDPFGNIIFANEAFRNIVGLKKEELIGKNYQEIFNIYEVDNLGHLKAQIDLLMIPEQTPLYQDTARSKETKEFKLLPKTNPAETYVELTTAPIMRKQQKSEEKPGTVVVIRDVTEKKELERMRLDFVSIAAHELRTPLTSIRGYLSTLKEEAWGVLNDEQKSFVERADIASMQLVTLMENLLSVSRIERGTLTLELKEVDWVTFLEEKAEIFRTRAKERSLEFIWEKPIISIPKVKADQMRIGEVINNLISNAINYTASGYIKVSIEYDQKNEMVITHIQDTGQGIPKNALPHMFEKFFRVAGAIERGSKGTGLGLYISKQIIELHHGQIWVESEEGKGSTFSFSLASANKKGPFLEGYQ